MHHLSDASEDKLDSLITLCLSLKNDVGNLKLEIDTLKTKVSV